MFAATVLTSPSTSANAKTSLKAVLMTLLRRVSAAKSTARKDAYIRSSQIDVRQHTEQAAAKTPPVFRRGESLEMELAP
jgi:hypothetical protein